MAFDIQLACKSFVWFVRQHEPDFILTDSNKFVIKILVGYFCNSKIIEEYGYSLDKGIWLYGNNGNFKTSLMNYLSKWTSFKPYRVVDCRDIQKEVLINGFEELFKYGKFSFNWKPQGGRIPEHGSIDYCFDDLGTEIKMNTKYFGTDLNVMEEIIIDRYKYFDSFGMLTHVTSNFGKDWDLLQGMYGMRVRSRARQMFNFIEITDKDFRK